MMMMMMMMNIMMKIKIAITRTIFKLGGPDIGWYQIYIIPKDDIKDDDHNDDNDDHNDDGDDEDQKGHNSDNFQARKSRFCMI